jgi:hypothetical protein
MTLKAKRILFDFISSPSSATVHVLQNQNKDNDDNSAYGSSGGDGGTKTDSRVV